MDQLPPVQVPANAKPITRMLILGATGKRPAIHHAPYLLALTHLHMTGKKISTIQVSDPKDANKPILAGQCPNLQFLYLENNYLTDMSGTLSGLKGLIQINLHGN